jgi:uncharacterized protein involved in cysteine biosynthesis
MLRVAAGAYHLLAGLAELRHPALWPVALPAAAAALAFVVGGAFLAVLAFSRVLDLLAPVSRKLPEWLESSMLLGWAGGFALAGVLLGLSLSLLLSAVTLERLAKRVEAGDPAVAAVDGQPQGWALGQWWRGAGLLLSWMVLTPLVALLPLLGPLLAVAVGAVVLGQGLFHPPLIRRGLDLGERRAFCRRFRPEAVGLGAAAVVTLSLPGLNLLLAGPLAPALWLGASRLVSALQGSSGAIPKEEGPEAAESPRPESVDDTGSG